MDTLTGFPQFRKWSRKNKILPGQGKVREFYFESGKIEILKKSRGKLEYNTADFIQSVLAGEDISGQCDFSDVCFFVWKRRLDA